jgi:hypothetical protein
MRLLRWSAFSNAQPDPQIGGVDFSELSKAPETKTFLFVYYI